MSRMSKAVGTRVSGTVRASRSPVTGSFSVEHSSTQRRATSGGLSGSGSVKYVPAQNESLPEKVVDSVASFTGSIKRALTRPKE